MTNDIAQTDQTISDNAEGDTAPTPVLPAARIGVGTLLGRLSGNKTA